MRILVLIVISIHRKPFLALKKVHLVKITPPQVPTTYSTAQASYLQVELASELESDLRDTVDWGRKWCVDFSAGKTQLISFDQSSNTGAIDVKMNGSVFEEKSYIKMLELILSSKLDWGSHIISIVKTASKKIGALIHSMKFLSPEVASYL